MLQLLPGIHKFKTEVHESNEEFFQHLAKGQNPETMFITCSDSRVVPNLITQTDPGELFVLRNAGNIVPAHAAVIGGEEASIEYAVMALGIKNIVVCGHSQCGAVKGILNPQTVEQMPGVAKWLEHSAKTREIIKANYSNLDEDCQYNIAIQENVLVQMENIKTHPVISRLLWKREVHVFGWVYEMESGEVFIYDPVDETFQPIAYQDGEFHMMDHRSMHR